MGCVLPGGPEPASPPRPPFQHRGQRPARRTALPASQQLVCLSTAWALRWVLIPSASFPITHPRRPPPSLRGPLGEAARQSPEGQTRLLRPVRSRDDALLPTRARQRRALRGGTDVGAWQLLKCAEHGRNPTQH